MKKKHIVFAMVCSLVCFADAAWYWPFGDDDKKDEQMPTLMEPVSALIDDAGDLAEDGKISDAVDKYREALKELDKLEEKYPDRAGTPEFSTVKTKRAYVSAAIDSLLLAETRKNARAVAVTDTTELEKKYKKLKEAKDSAKNPPAPPVVDTEEETPPAVEAVAPAETSAETSAEKKAEKKAGKDEATLRREEIAEMLSKDPRSRRAKLLLAREDILAGDYQPASLAIAELLQEKPNDAAALNMRAFMEIRQKDYKAAEKTLDQCIMSNPRSHNAYYNLARLYLTTRGASGKDAARRFYETGRKFGGKSDAALEAELK